MNNNMALELVVKGGNLCRYIAQEKNEELLSKKLFEAICLLSENIIAVNSSFLSKAEISVFRKNASLAGNNALLYLDAIFSSGFISAAQKDSMSSSVEAIKKEFNL